MKATFVIVIFFLIIIAFVGSYFLAYQTSQSRQSMSTDHGSLSLQSSSTTCSGYPPTGTCHANYSYTFAISVNYSGSWILKYYGFHNGEGISSPPFTGSYLVSQNITGNGYYSMQVTLSGDNYYFLTLCGWAQKQDYSDATLTLSITGSNSTSGPHGSTYYCGGVVP